MIRRTTLRSPSNKLFGIGLHTGSPTWLQILPVESPGVGILFRNYLTGGEVQASWKSISSTNRSTCLKSESTHVDTVEHVLSALYGCGVTDAVVLFEGQELPIGDGSALVFVELIESVGICQIDGFIDELTIDHEVVVSDGYGTVLTAVPSDHLWVLATVDYSTYSAIGIQSARFGHGDYKSEISLARTYGFYHELDALKTAGLGRGVNLENVIALGSDGEVDPNTPLRLKDELVRHKILDLLGDLSLSQRRLKFGIVALKPSHKMNAVFTGALLGLGGS